MSKSKKTLFLFRYVLLYANKKNIAHFLIGNMMGIVMVPLFSIFFLFLLLRLFNSNNVGKKILLCLFNFGENCILMQT